MSRPHIADLRRVMHDAWMEDGGCYRCRGLGFPLRRDPATAAVVGLEGEDGFVVCEHSLDATLAGLDPTMMPTEIQLVYMWIAESRKRARNSWSTVTLQHERRDVAPALHSLDELHAALQRENASPQPERCASVEYVGGSAEGRRCRARIGHAGPHLYESQPFRCTHVGRDRRRCLHAAEHPGSHRYAPLDSIAEFVASERYDAPHNPPLDCRCSPGIGGTCAALPHRRRARHKLDGHRNRTLRHRQPRHGRHRRRVRDRRNFGDRRRQHRDRHLHRLDAFGRRNRHAHVGHAAIDQLMFTPCSPVTRFVGRQPQPARYVISGNVIDVASAPVPGATVEVFESVSHRFVGSAVTDSNGNYSIDVTSSETGLTFKAVALNGAGTAGATSVSTLVGTPT